MHRVPILVFETNLHNLELLAIELQLKNVRDYVLHFVPLKKNLVPPKEGYFLDVLEQHRPKFLITNWQNIGPVVKKAEQAMRGLRPLEKWILSEYEVKKLAEQPGGNPIGYVWVDEIYEKPISPYLLVERIERQLAILSPTPQVS